MAAPAAFSSSSRHLFRHLRQPQPLPLPSCSLKPFFAAASSAFRNPTSTATFAALRLRCPLPLRDSTSSPKPLPPPFAVSLLHTHSASEAHQIELDYSEIEDGDEDKEAEDEKSEDGIEAESVSDGCQEIVSESKGSDVDENRSQRVEVGTPPILTVKEKKELSSYAHSLGKKLKSQQVGKSGITASVASSFIETLESNELLKLKIHGNCPGELADVVKQLEGATGSVIVSQIGRTVILYRPSLTKLKAEEKRREARRVYVRKGYQAKPALMEKAKARAAAKEPGRGRRGSSRF